MPDAKKDKQPATYFANDAAIDRNACLGHSLYQSTHIYIAEQDVIGKADFLSGFMTILTLYRENIPAAQ